MYTFVILLKFGIRHVQVNNIGDAGAKDLANALETNSSLIHLNLSRNGIDNAELTKIEKLLERNQLLSAAKSGSNTARLKIATMFEPYIEEYCPAIMSSPVATDEEKAKAKQLIIDSENPMLLALAEYEEEQTNKRKTQNFNEEDLEGLVSTLNALIASSRKKDATHFFATHYSLLHNNENIAKHLPSLTSSFYLTLHEIYNEQKLTKKNESFSLLSKPKTGNLPPFAYKVLGDFLKNEKNSENNNSCIRMYRMIYAISQQEIAKDPTLLNPETNNIMKKIICGEFLKNKGHSVTAPLPDDVPKHSLPEDSFYSL